MAGLRSGSSISTDIEQAAADLVSADTVGEIEREGIRRARERALQSDLVIVLISIELHVDGHAQLAMNHELISAVRECGDAGKDMVFVVNKVDLLHRQTSRSKKSISRLLSELVSVFPQADLNNIFCLSCRKAHQTSKDEGPDPGGLQTFIEGLVRKFGSMTQALVDPDARSGSDTVISAAEAQSYWTASLSVTHRQSQFLHECLIHLDNFLDASRQSTDLPITPTPPQPPLGYESASVIEDIELPDHAYFDTRSSKPIVAETADGQYHIDNHADLVGEIGAVPPTNRESKQKSSIPYSWANTNTSDIDLHNEEIDIVTAAEHLRAAADCLSKLTGRGDSASSGIDVEDVLGVVFEK